MIECTVNAKIILERAVVKEESIPHFRYYNYLARFWKRYNHKQFKS